MDLFTLLAAAVIAMVGQYLNRHKSIPAAAVKAVLVLVGLPFYAWHDGLPPSWWGPSFASWSQMALLWCFAIPGMASLIGAIPGMETNSK